MPVEASLLPHLDTLSSLTELIDQVKDCSPDRGGSAMETSTVGARLPTDGCPGVLYTWSPLMPLSRHGIGNIAEATDDLGIQLTVVDGRTLRRGMDGPGDAAPLVQAIVAAGATVHYPSILVHREGQLLGTAILGYKTADAYRHMIGERLRTAREAGVQEQPPMEAGSPGLALNRSSPSDVQRDYPVDGEPGVYFRSVPGRKTLAFEAGRRVYLLDLESGRTALAPGYIDFVPTPHGRFFVTPGPDRSGLEFYDADRVFEASRRGRGDDVEPFFVDPRMRDQYPSAGILRSEDGTTIYRVLTSWFDRVRFRDYAVRMPGEGGEPEVRPLGSPVIGCAHLQVSIPIMSKDGSELPGRDEATATTKIFRLHDDGSCEELLDLGLQTGKVAFGPEGRRVAFAVPRGAIQDGTGRRYFGTSGEEADELAGIFVLDRDRGLITRIRGSEAVYRLAFPDFVGRDSVVFLLSGTDDDQRSRFRLVCCVSDRRGG